jgi:hypothetical protein
VSAPGSSIDAAEPFGCFVEELLSDPAVTRTDRPGRASLRVDGRVFATDYEGYLILRLPRERADAVIAAGLARRLDPGHDSLLNEWLVLEPSAEESCGPLAREALDSGLMGPASFAATTTVGMYRSSMTSATLPRGSAHRGRAPPTIGGFRTARFRCSRRRLRVRLVSAA